MYAMKIGGRRVMQAEEPLVQGSGSMPGVVKTQKECQEAWSRVSKAKHGRG